MMAKEHLVFTRGHHYVHVIADRGGEEAQIWAGEMHQVPAVGDRIRLHIGGADHYQLFWVTGVAWSLFCEVEGGHGEVGQPYVYVK